jgi:cob(I)alamin adenosyltransferase
MNKKENTNPKIYTKTGDKGKTSLLGGQRVMKNHERLEAYGTIDELNSTIGMLLNHKTSAYDKNLIDFIQNKLFDAGAFLAAEKSCSQYPLPELKSISDSDIKQLEQAIDIFSTGLPELKNFIIPAGSEQISWCNIARTVCRRAERRVISIKNARENYINIIIFINRLSDLLFVMGRKYAKENNIKEILWKNV